MKFFVAIVAAGTLLTALLLFESIAPQAQVLPGSPTAFSTAVTGFLHAEYAGL